RTVPLHATSTGKAYLAYLPEEEQEAVLPRRLERYTPTTVTDRRSLADELRGVRRAGYAICVGELEESLFGASAPVLSEQGRPVAIVSVWGTEHRLPCERLPEVGRRRRTCFATTRTPAACTRSSRRCRNRRSRRSTATASAERSSSRWPSTSGSPTTPPSSASPRCPSESSRAPAACTASPGCSG